ncbi:auxilin-like clathrin-binding protein required for normal clathrin function [Coemansia sp. RSA 2131]|nr:auxilin-like clathrin-binding protein required for normal clathrin function [Coemansia sp. RSA 2131]
MDDLAGLSWPGDQKKQGSMNSQRTGAFAPNYSPSTSSVNPSGTHSRASQKDDPFGELVSFSGSSQKSQAKMSLRERQQMLENEQSRSSSPFSFQQTQSGDSNMFPNAAKDTWNFDAFDISTRPATPMQKPKATNVSMDFDPLATQPGQTGSDMGFGMPTHKAQEAVSSDDEPIPMDAGQPSSEPFVDKDFEIAQVAGYGFSIKQAKAALEITGSPRAAIKLLREQTAVRNVQRPEMQQKPQASRSRLRTPYRDEPSHTSYRDEPSRTSYRDEPSRTPYRDEPSHTYLSSDDEYHYNRGTRSQHNNGSQQSGQASSDSFLATANGLGTSMMKQANSWFAMGKKKLMEIQESVEQRRWPGDGDAKWNTDFEPGYSGSGPQRYRDYSDSSSDDEPYVSANRHSRQNAKPVESRPRPAHVDAPIMDMMSDYDAAPAPVPRQHQQPPPTQSRTPASSQQPAAIPTVAESILISATAAKTSANEQFKLGQFGDAVSGYSAAIGQVVQHSDIHPVLIVLLNNRALAYARNGEAKMAVADCTQVLQLSDRYQANSTVDLGQIGQINIVEQRAKALQRRAEAFETNERYQDGLSDWKALREIARDANMRQQSTRGVQRCEKVLGIGQPAQRPSPAAAAPKAEDLANVFASISMATVKSGNPTILTAHTENSAAVAEMRRKEQARRTEDDQRLAMHDQVEAELRRWKDGKQQNLRALLCSVHLLLPNFTPIGMHEIIEANKVKRAYMRTIARLHPDKLAKDVDVRTNMVSSSVFTLLNEAWDAFKAQEGVN